MYLKRLKDLFNDCQKQLISQTSIKKVLFTRLEKKISVHTKIQIE